MFLEGLTFIFLSFTSVFKKIIRSEQINSFKRVIFLITILLCSCSSNPSQKNKRDEKSKEDSHVINGNLSLKQRIVKLQRSMTIYMYFSTTSYTENEIMECGKILEQYLYEIERTKSKEEAIAIVKSTVLKLNKLNKGTSSTLIETNEREQIADIINTAVFEKGFNPMNEDITFEWREW